MAPTNGFGGVSNCYVFKSQLQEYAQKAGFMTPVYETLKEGPSHQPCFQSTVIVNNVRYDSLPGFLNRKAAEQSAAEVALLELAKSGNLNESISHPLHGTGLCKNLLQEYAQKMNYAIPSYTLHADEALGRNTAFSCTVNIGGIMYVGAAANSKKEAEIKAARTALLAIQPHNIGAEVESSGSQLTVLPGQKKVAEPDVKKEETTKPLKTRKSRFKKNFSKRRSLQKRVDQATGDAESSMEIQVGCGGAQEMKGDDINNDTGYVQAGAAVESAVGTSENVGFENGSVCLRANEQHGEGL